MIVKHLKFGVRGSRGSPKRKWKKQVENEMRKNELVKEDAYDRTKWRNVVKAINYHTKSGQLRRGG